ncbi:MAG: 6-carboxytetrahydropterin synthase QueD [Bacteroidetes bacterium 4572_77]|nr:MAG: 6-carboxytetrahydropterin synthase QueD [Bacteroidetes bacterium 4572_77]
MTKIRVTKEFKFETAHALMGYDGLCKHIHGHSYVLLVTVIGTPISDKESPKLGMVVDFGDLKRIVKKEIVDKMDHCLVLNQNGTKAQALINSDEMFERVIMVSYQPTSENMLIDFVERLKDKLPESLQLKHMLLRETITSYAEWFADDQ